MTEELLRILIVEDDPVYRELFRTLLDPIGEHGGYHFLEAETGEAGLAQYRSERPNCILLDYRLPDFDGLEFLAALGFEDDQVPVPVIMLTGEGSEILVAKAMKAGAADYMPKSALSAMSLRRSISNAIEKSKLRAAIAEQHRVLAQTNFELQRKNAEIQQFYHLLSHEMKTPLTSAREFVSIVLDGLAGSLSEAQREYLSYARESCDQMTLGLNDLLDSTRLETGKLHIALQPGCVSTLVARVVVSMAPQAQDKRIQLEQSIAPDLPQVLMDEKRITQVLTNLLSNALKFTPERGEVSVRVGNDPERPRCVLVSVSDTGRGIEPAQLDQVFDRLYQIRSGDATIEGGLGLGLYICREVVRLHGGEIWVDSTPGEGSTFFFTVPKCVPAIH
ncbi:MAG: ATP-binding protein [Gammaproteobacteria bacterium]